eukprot:5975866-Pleurochrysis_carterae.AAC.3
MLKGGKDRAAAQLERLNVKSCKAFSILLSRYSHSESPPPPHLLLCLLSVPTRPSFLMSPCGVCPRHCLSLNPCISVPKSLCFAVLSRAAQQAVCMPIGRLQLSSLEEGPALS